MSPTKQFLLEGHEMIRPFIHKTPILTSSYINDLSGSKISFKCENFQRMGAFKMRGATHAMLRLTKDQQQIGVVTHSSGNMAQAVALGAKQLGIPAYIVMPSNAPQVKKNAVIDYGGVVTECEPTIEAREAMADEIVNRTGATLLHPSNDLNVIVGQATSAIELLIDKPNLEAILAPVGGGGLIAGTALAVKYFGSNCVTIGGEPMLADDAYRSLSSGKIEFNKTTNTIADGLMSHLGDINFPIIKDNVKNIIRVEEDEIISAMRLIWERMKIIVEPSCAVALAAVLKEKNLFVNKNIGIILTGGNVDLGKLPF